MNHHPSSGLRLLAEKEADERRTASPKWGSSPYYAKAFGFLPLALSVLLFSTACCAWGIYNIVHVTGVDFAWDDVGEVITGCFKILIGVTGCVATAVRWANGLHFVLVAYNIFVVSQGVALLTKWLEWSLAMTGITTENHVKWKPSAADLRYMGVYTSSIMVLVVASYLWFVGWIKSLKRVVQAGGSGWEGLNYIAILDAKFAAEEQEGITEFQQKYGAEQAPRLQMQAPLPTNTPGNVAPQRSIRKADPGDPSPMSLASTTDYEDADTRVTVRTLSDWL